MAEQDEDKTKQEASEQEASEQEAGDAASLEEDLQDIDAEVAAEEAEEAASAGPLVDWESYMLGNELLVQPLEAPTKIGSIETPEGFRDKHRPEEGIVLMTGPGKLLPSGQLVPMTVRKGDRVHYGKHAGHELKLEDSIFKVLREDEVLFGWRPKNQVSEEPQEPLKEPPPPEEVSPEEPLTHHPV